MNPEQPPADPPAAPSAGSAEQMELLSIASRLAKLGAWSLEFPGPKLIWSDEVFRIHEIEPGNTPDIETALNFYPPASREKLEAAIQAGQPYDLELEFITVKGNHRWVRTTGAVERRDGVVSRYYGIIQDLTERKRMEMRFRLLVDSNVQGVFFWRRNGEVFGANDSFLSLIGYSRRELEEGHINWIALTPPEYVHLDRRTLEEIALGGVGPQFEKEFIRKDGVRIPILIGGAAFEDNPFEGVCFVIDRTESKKIENQLLHSQRLESMGRLAGGIAHDLNNILTPILMSLGLLRKLASDPESQTILNTVEESARRGADIVHQVLSFARGANSTRIAVNPRRLLNDLEKIINDTFPKQIRFKSSISSDAWMIFGDPKQLKQLLLNLCFNARDAMPRGGDLTVSIQNALLGEQVGAMNLRSKPGCHVRITVADSGAGIPPAIIDKIFEPFFTTREVGEGGGLGLSTVIAIAKSHEGIITVRSDPGAGATFDIHLPALDAQSHGKQERPAPTPSAAGNSGTILVVDDEPSILAITGKILQSAGYRVLTAANGAEGVALYAEKKAEISLILTDMMMPVMDGKAMIHSIRLIDPAAKIIAVTGLNPVLAAGNNALFGLKHTLAKPYTSETLIRLVQEALSSEE